MTDVPRPDPPRFWACLLRIILPDGVVSHTIMGDLHEEYGDRVVQGGLPGARSWYRRESIGIGARAARRWAMRSDEWERRTFSGQPNVKRQGDSMFSNWLRDVWYAWRSLMRSPGYTAIIVLTLALGIGANAVVFTVVKSVLLDPLPFRDAHELVQIMSRAPGANVPDEFGVSDEFYVQYKEAPGLVSLGLYGVSGGIVRDDNGAERLRMAEVTPDYFETLGAQPILGRLPTAEESALDTAQVVVISSGLWARRFGSDPTVVGRSVEVADRQRTIVGVMGEDFRHPERETAVWFTRIVDFDGSNVGEFSQQLIARVRPGMDEEVLLGQLKTLADRLPELYASAPRYVAFLTEGQYTPVVHPLKEFIVGELQQPLWILLGTVGFVLLIVCANVANLFMVRAEGRRRELAVRAALGAGRRRLIQLHLSEALVLASLGGVLGAVLAIVGVPAMLRLAPESLPRIDEIQLDVLSLTFTAGISLLAAVAFGLLPAIKHSSRRMIDWLKDSSRGSSAGRERQLTRNSLVVVQSGLALVLLVGSGLLIRSFWALRSVDPGFDSQDILTFQLSLPVNAYPGAERVAGFHQQIAEGLRGLPGVESVGAVANVPLSAGMSGVGVEIERASSDGQPPIVYYTYVMPNYFETMGITVRQGRALERADQETRLGNAVISETMARTFWPNQNPIGERFRFAGDTTGWETVVGVVEDVRDVDLRTDPKPAAYLPFVGRNRDNNQIVRSPAFVVRAHNPETLVSAVRAQIGQLDGSLPIYAIQTMEQIVNESVVRLTFTMIALAVSAAMALILGSVGLYGVLSYVVSQRTHEIGLRLALGAGSTQVLKMVVAQGVRLAGLGLALGIAGAAVLTRLLQGLLYGTEPLDIRTFAGMSLVMLVVSLLASYLPARKASAVDPMSSMRME